MSRPDRRALRPVRSVLLFVAAMVAVAGCGLADQARFTVRNDTADPVTVYVDDGWIGTVGPGAGAELALPVGGETIEIQARTPSGAVLASLAGTRAMFDAALDGSGPMSAWQDLPCGRVLLAVGPFDASALGPPPSPSAPCP